MSDLALYIHWPFCKSKCPYCDFNSHVRQGVDDARWRAALLAELDHYAEATRGRRLGSIFFGGGTPSLMAPATAAALLDRAARHWSAADDLEVTLEANPTSVEAARFRDFRAAGVNRVSLGVQALDDRALRFLGRGHDAGEARAAIDLARRYFDRYSFDLIYARPDQSLASWEAELDAALALAGDHLSVYQLMRAAILSCRTMTSPARSMRRRRIGSPRRACRPTKSPTMRGQAANPGTILSIGVTAIMSASVPAPTGG
jgi:oxygen-independent coproporphyrinogen-3 oxidase